MLPAKSDERMKVRQAPPSSAHSPLERLNTDRLCRLFNFCSASKKLGKLRFINRQFNSAVFLSSSWDAVHTFKFVSPPRGCNATERAMYEQVNPSIPLKYTVYELCLQLPAEIDEDLQYKLPQCLVNDYCRLVKLLDNLKVIGLHNDINHMTHLPVALIDLFLSKVDQHLQQRKLRCCDVKFLVRGRSIVCSEVVEEPSFCSFWLPLARLLHLHHHHRHSFEVRELYLSGLAECDYGRYRGLDLYYDLVLGFPQINRVVLSLGLCDQLVFRARQMPLFVGKSVKNLKMTLNSWRDINENVLPLINGLKKDTLQSMEVNAIIRSKRSLYPIDKFINHLQVSQLSVLTSLKLSTFHLPTAGCDLPQATHRCVKLILQKAPNLISLELVSYKQQGAGVSDPNPDFVELLELCWKHAKKVGDTNQMVQVRIDVATGCSLVPTFWSFYHKFGAEPFWILSSRNNGRSIVIEEKETAGVKLRLSVENNQGEFD